PLVAKRPHRFEPFLLARPAAAHPDLHTVELALDLSLAEAGDDAAERLLHVGEVRDGAAHDDMLDPRQRTDLLRRDLHRPVRLIAGVFRVVGQLAAAGHYRVGIIAARAAARRQPRPA